MLPKWINKYIGIPFAERGRDHDACDCWGLFRLIQLEQFNRELPEYLEYANVCDDMAVVRIFKQESKRWDTVKGPQAGDAILFLILGRRYHVGVVVSPGWFVHVSRGIGASCENYERPLWKNRILAFYRYNVE